MRYDEFEREFPGYLRDQESATVRKWKQRGEVPEKHVLSAQAVTSVTKPLSESVTSVTKPVTRDESVTEVCDVLIPSAERGHPEFDIMDDGWARGFAKDQCPGFQGNRIYRTYHAIRRFAERKMGSIDEGTPVAKKWCTQFEQLQTSDKRIAFLKKIAAESAKEVSK